VIGVGDLVRTTSGRYYIARHVSRYGRVTLSPIGSKAKRGTAYAQEANLTLVRSADLVRMWDQIMTARRYLTEGRDPQRCGSLMRDAWNALNRAIRAGVDSPGELEWAKLAHKMNRDELRDPRTTERIRQMSTNYANQEV